MKLLFCVQRYGAEVAGGSEAAARDLAERLAARGHDVEVVTSRARSYVDWADYYEDDVEVLNGVTVHRLSVRQPRTHEQFAPIHGRVLDGSDSSLLMQRDWLRVQGPDLPELEPWLRKHARRFDAVLYFTYLYPTTALTIGVAAAYRPTVLHPTAHDEPMMWLRVFDSMFRAADALVCLTPEELQLIDRRFRWKPAITEVIGLGIELDERGNGRRFRDGYGLGDRPYALFLGRLDPGKGTDELYRMFVTLREKQPELDLALVVMGEPVTRPEPHPDVIVTGFVDERTKYDALAGATLLTQPSYFESFSIALCEGWVYRLPAVVQDRCAVLGGQARRSRAALPYTSYSQFAAEVERLLGDEPLRQQMGELGRRYVVENYSWNSILARYERLLGRAIASRW